MEIAAVFILVFLAVRILVSLINCLTPVHLPEQKPATTPKISLLIPARNEEANIGNLLNGLKQLDYPDYEVIVCNDHSSDNTEEILNWFSGENEHIHWFLGKKLPDNWCGKNYACHQLAEKAAGQYLVFIDADVELAPGSLNKAVAFFQEKRLTLLSVFPQQHMRTFAEQITVPVMNWILQSLLPLWLVRILKFPSVSAANGQFMMFDAANYKKHHWHEQVRNLHVEDIHIARKVKAGGFRMAVMLGDRDVFCRMYRKGGEAVSGFSRNIHEYFAGKRWVMSLFCLLVLSGPAVVWLGLGNTALAVFLLLVVLNRFFTAYASRQNLLFSVVLHPLQMLSFGAIVIHNLTRKFKNVTEWKGRKIKFQA